MTDAPNGPIPGIDTAVPPSGPGCVECEASASWWFHLRRCAQCGHIGCCDSSPNQHATAHNAQTGHPFITSFEPGEDWMFSFADGRMYEAVLLAPPTAHPADQPTPGPADRVPADWQSRLRA